MGHSLFDYQIDGVGFLLSRRFALLADDMGIGKTAQAISAANALDATRITVVCPAFLRNNWMREFHTWFAKGVQITVVGDGKERIPSTGVVITSTDLTTEPSILAQLLARRNDVLIWDETKDGKERTTQRTRAVMGPALDGKDGIAGTAEHIWFLNATPVLNHPGELYPMLKLFGIWKKGYAEFLNAFCVWSNHRKYGVRVRGVINVSVLRDMLRPVVLRRRKRDVLRHLPPLIESEIYVEAEECDPVHKFLRDLRTLQPVCADKVKRAVEEQDWSFGDDPAIARVRRLIGLAKIPGLTKQLIDDLNKRVYKMVVFGIHRDFLKYTDAYLNFYRPTLVWGGMPDKKRQSYIDRFQQNEYRRVFLGQMKAAGVGLTLTAADTVTLGERDWTPAVEDQAIMRVHRIGQYRPVHARRTVLADSLDKAITQVGIRKSLVIDAIFP